jgi:hypothetical protein
MVLLSVIFSVLIFLSACSPTQSPVLERELLFELEIGRLEHELGIFARNGVLPQRHDGLVIRDGIIYIGNGSSNKIMGFTSFGDLLQLVYSENENPQPVTLAGAPRGEAVQPVTRRFVPVKFSQLETIAVDSRRWIYATELVPQQDQVRDDSLGIMLNRRILRMNAHGIPQNYLGQDGIGGTPFPLITGMSVTVRDELVVVGSTGEAKKVWFFSSEGESLATVRIGLDRLPVPSDAGTYLSILDSVVPGIDKHRVYLKISYYRTVTDPDSQQPQGIEFDHSRVYWLDLSTGRYEGYAELPRRGETGVAEHFQLLGITRGEHMLLLTRIDDDRSQLVMMNSDGRVLRRRVLQISQRNLLQRSFYVTPEGILGALLVYPERAEVVWWRSDRLLPGQLSREG